jgi:hypothetical protein
LSLLFPLEYLVFLLVNFCISSKLHAIFSFFWPQVPVYPLSSLSIIPKKENFPKELLAFDVTLTAHSITIWLQSFDSKQPALFYVTVDICFSQCIFVFLIYLHIQHYSSLSFFNFFSILYIFSVSSSTLIILITAIYKCSYFILLKKFFLKF